MPTLFDSDLGTDRFEHVRHEAQAIFDRSAISVGPEIASVAEELVNKVAVRSVDLDAVKPCQDRISGGG